MITRAGWLTLGGAAAVAGAGRTLGLVELHVLAAAGFLAVATAVLRVAVVRPGIAVRRTVRPARVHVGTPARVELDVTAPGPRRSPVLFLYDPIGDRAGARLRLAPLAPGARTSAAYRLPTRQRGEVAVGPLQVEVTDPLGLARRRQPGAEQVRLVVLPHVDHVAPLPRPAGSQPLSGHEGRPGAGHAGDEFHSLRPYVVGDDLRRVHWPMSARHDDLVVRVDDEPRQGRTTVVLDLDPPGTGPEAFERMVSAAASIAAAHWRTGDMVRLLCSDGRDTGWVAGQAAFEGLLEVLAVARQGGGGGLVATLRHVGDGSDSMAAVTGALPDEEVARLPARLSSRRGPGPASLTVVRLRGPGAGPARGVVRGITVVDVDGRPFPAVWAESLARPRPRVGAP